MKAFRISGRFLMKREWTRFAKEVAGKDEEHAVEILVSDLGSKHRVRRKDIHINDVLELKKEEVKDPIVQFKLMEGEKNDGR